MAQQKARQDQVQPFELSEAAKPLAYDAAVRIMLNMDSQQVMTEVGISAADLQLIRLMYEAETNGNSPEVVAFGRENMVKLRSSYLLARGKYLWEKAFGAMTPAQANYLELVVQYTVQDDERNRVMSAFNQAAAEKDFELFELQLSRLILAGQQRIMDSLKPAASTETLKLINCHEQVLLKQLELIDSLEELKTGPIDAFKADPASTAGWDGIDVDNN